MIATLLQHAPEAAANAAQAELRGGGEGSPTGPAIFMHVYHHVLAQPLKINGEPLVVRVGGYELPIFNLQIAQVVSVILMFVLFSWAKSGLVAGKQNRVQRILTGWVLWIRDDMARPILGPHLSHKLLPYFLTVFFFLAFNNLLGLFPNPFHPLIPHGDWIPLGVTANACIFVTAGMALTTLLFMIGGGMVMNGPLKFWTGLVPHGIPAALWPLMFVVELVGLFVKPFALTIRLFANMTGGHLVVLSFVGILFYFGQASMLGSLGYVVALPAVAFAIFIMIIEAFVALLQAYIFTLLSLLFIGASLHPEH
ncbi:MAG: F0F1 ATP synthase subunit A [Planctomycetes bacterium]|nr:F0F1 ATP synthase subunit A [Planctomycetota bacterium]